MPIRYRGQRVTQLRQSGTAIRAGRWGGEDILGVIASSINLSAAFNADNSQATITPTVIDGTNPLGRPLLTSWAEVYDDIGIEGTAEFTDLSIPQLDGFSADSTTLIPGGGTTRGLTVRGQVGAAFTLSYTINGTASPSVGAASGTIGANGTAAVLLTIPASTVGTQSTIVITLGRGAGTAFADTLVSTEVSLTQDVGSVTIRINFTDSTGPLASLSSTSTVQLTGIPGQDIPNTVRSVSRTNDSTSSEGPSTRLNDITCVSDDPAITCTVTGSGRETRTITVDGVFPATNRDIRITVFSSSVTLASRGCTINQFSGLESSNGFVFNIRATWAGGGTGSFFARATTDEFFNPNSGPAARISQGQGSTSNGDVRAVFDANDGSLTAVTVGYSVAESSTHRSCSRSASRTF